MSTPKQNSTPAGLSAAQGRYYNQLTSGRQNAQETLDYVKSLNDLQSLASLASTQGKYADVQSYDNNEFIGNLESLYQAPIITHLGQSTRGSSFRPVQSAADSVIPPAPIVETTPLTKSNDTGMTAQPLYTSLTAASTPDQIAAAYGQLANQAGGDTQYNQEQAVAYLRNLGVSDATIMAGYNQYLNPLGQVVQSDNSGNTSSTGIGALDIANTAGLGSTGIGVNTATGLKVDDEVAEAFETVFGRAPTQGELTTLRDKYGYTIEPGELNQIVLSKRDANVGYGVATTQTVTPVYGTKEVIDENGELTQVTTITGYRDQNGNAVDPSLVSTAQVGNPESGNETTVYNVAVDPLSFSGGVVGKLTQQILDQGNTQYFSGEGYGSADKNVADMALLLAAAGITDINQFGKVSVAADAAVTPIYEQKLMYDPEMGEYMGQTIVGYKDVSGKAVDPSLVRTDYNEDGSFSYTAPVGTKQVFGNTATGKAIDSHYDKANDDIFSGTFAGEGSTGYGVKFKADGSPVFYTQYMGSSNDLAQLQESLGPLGQIAFAVATGGLSIPQQIAAQAALSLASGADFKDVAKNIAISSILPGIPGTGFIQDGVNFLNTIDTSGVLGKAFTSATSSGAKAALTKQDIGDAILAGAIGGGTAGAIDFMAGNIPGFSDLSASQQNMVKNAMSGVASGQRLDQVLINTAIEAGKNAVTTAVNDKLGETAFVDSKRTGATDQEAFDASDALTRIANANETFDGSALGRQDEAMNAALADGKDKFTFGGKTFTIDNSAAMVADYTNSVLADAKAETDLRVKSDSEFGDLAGAQAAATARNTVAIGSAEANDVNEAAYLAKIRDPSATSFTFDGKTYSVSASQSQMDKAIADAKSVELKDSIANASTRNEAFRLAREGGLGAKDKFTWQGKEYSAATAEERPDLSAPKVQAATDESAAETARLNRQNTALVTGNAPDQSAAETTRLANLNAGLKSMEKTSFLGQIYKDLNEEFRLQGVAANEYLANNPNSPITNSISTAFEAAGNLQKNVGGGTALLLNNKPLSDALVKGGDDLTKLGQSIGTGPQDTKNWNDTLGLIDKAKGFEKVAIMAGRIMDGTSGLGRQVEVELRQELPGLFLGGGGLRATMVATGLMDTAETAGNAALDAYENAVKNGKNHNDALSDARVAGAVAGATEAAVQLTLGKVADVVAGRVGNIASKTGTKVVGEGIVEGGQEGGAALAVDLALGNELDANKYLTQAVVGGAVGKGAATATSGVDVAQTDASTSGVSTGATATDLGTVGATVPGADVVQGTDLGSIGSVTPGADAVVGGASTLGDAGAATISVADAEQVMSDLGLNVSGDAAVSLATKIQEATSSGNNVSLSSDANIVTINDATANTKTTVDAGTGITTVVDGNSNTTSQTKVDGNTQTTVVADANNNTTTQTVVNGNTTTSTTVDNTTKSTTQTTITGDTQTTVLTDPNTNTQTTVKVNINTGDVIDVKEVEIPADWTPPVIKTPEVKTPEVPYTPPTAVAEEVVDKTSKAKPKKPGEEGGAGGIGGAGLPLGIGVDPASLRSKVTGDAIDPLARVKQAQAELERDVMMNQMDPRFLAAIQQNSNPNQQAQQLDTDVGALAKMLRGESDAPANEGKYYSYGSEDSIDDILGGKAANYAAGGFVEPLRASGAMALPLMAKSGGALGKYNGREDFKDGKHVAGEGDGQSDDIPAWLADGEFVFPADVVSALGNGSTKAGTDKLYDMMHSIRDRARSKGPKDLPPPALKSPLDYLKSSKRSAK